MRPPRRRSFSAEVPASIGGGRYRVEAALGRGGTAAVYRAHDAATGRLIAVKRLITPTHRTLERSSALRFRREFHTLASLKHPRIVEVFDYGVDEAGPYYTMELLAGEDFRGLRGMAPPRACRLLRDVAAALAFLHARQLIHRDVSPRNVRSVDGEVAKLIDFGALATSGTEGEVIGTLPCMAPETARGLRVDERTDLFSLGATAYWLLTGRHAYPARALEDLPTAWARRPAPPSAFSADVPPALDALVLSMIDVDPLGRPASAVEVVERLGADGALEPLPATESALGYVASTPLIGRRPELARSVALMHRAIAAEGDAIIIESPSGLGKTRMLRELELEAKLAGALVVRADEATTPGDAFGTLRALGCSLLEGG